MKRKEEEEITMENGGSESSKSPKGENRRRLLDNSDEEAGASAQSEANGPDTDSYNPTTALGVLFDECLIGGSSQYDRLTVMKILLCLTLSTAITPLVFQRTQEFNKEFFNDDSYVFAWLLFCNLTPTIAATLRNSSNTFDVVFRGIDRDKLALMQDDPKAEWTKELTFSSFSVIATILIGQFFTNATPGTWEKFTVSAAIAMIVNDVRNLLRDHYRWLAGNFSPNIRTRNKYKIEEALINTIHEVRLKMLQETELPKELTPESNLSGIQLVGFFASKAQTPKYKIVAKKPLSSGDIFFRRLVPTGFGSVTVAGGVAGYIASTFEVIDKMDITSLGEKFYMGVSGSFFYYFSGALCIKAFTDLVDNFYIKLTTGKFPSSDIDTFHPILTPAIMSAFSFIAIFSFTTATQLITSSPYFKEGGALAHLRGPCFVLAIACSITIHNYQSRQLARDLIQEACRKLGSQKQKADFSQRVDRLITLLKNGIISEKKLAESLLQGLREDQINSAIPMHSAYDQPKMMIQSLTPAGIIKSNLDSVTPTELDKWQRMGVDQHYGTVEKAHEFALLNEEYRQQTLNELSHSSSSFFSFFKACLRGLLGRSYEPLDVAEAEEERNYTHT